ncbi:3203_t:CDS:1 [Paraglomus occultum]|uniref:3203_t:CDS:1 n=1 Tax=Paraglomus occultum TaxID=144539 RepID=A0A9N9H5I6_9GLOM|nr:3203_t:CDS:1 [Paraglomus occultum]
MSDLAVAKLIHNQSSGLVQDRCYVDTTISEAGVCIEVDRSLLGKSDD